MTRKPTCWSDATASGRAAESAAGSRRLLMSFADFMGSCYCRCSDIVCEEISTVCCMLDAYIAGWWFVARTPCFCWCSLRMWTGRKMEMVVACAILNRM